MIGDRFLPKNTKHRIRKAQPVSLAFGSLQLSFLQKSIKTSVKRLQKHGKYDILIITLIRKEFPLRLWNQNRFLVL